MIVPMEKATVFIYHKAREVFLMRLQERGLLHVEVEAAEVPTQRLNDIRDRIGRCDRFLKRAGARGLQAPEYSDEHAFETVAAEEEARHELDRLEARIGKTEDTLRSLEPWGDFDAAAAGKLKEAGVHVRFFIAAARTFEETGARGVPHAVISRDRTYVYFAVFERGPMPAIDADEFFYPAPGKAHFVRELASLKAAHHAGAGVLAGFYRKAAEVAGYRNFLISHFAFLNVRDHLPAAARETVYVLRGWVPKESKGAVAAFLAKEEVYAFFEEPFAGERPPVLLRNNRFARLFEPITKMFDLPNYCELDLTVLFAPFFTLFFGLCLGDAGYGLILVLGAALARRRVAAAWQGFLTLVQVLGASTCLCGLLVGTVFGFDISTVAGLRRVVVFDQDALFSLALILGLIQVLFGMAVKSVKIFRQQGFFAALAPSGWIILVLGLLGLTQTRLSLIAVWTGVALILLFNDMKVRLPLRLGKGLWELYGITGVFGDVLSYIRLFALGISSAILGLVVNDSARQMWGIPYAGPVLAPVFFIVFHTLNLALSGLSSFVHPLRLTFVEFYKNVGFEGGGKAFTPFARAHNKV